MEVRARTSDRINHQVQDPWRLQDRRRSSSSSRSRLSSSQHNVQPVTTLLQVLVLPDWVSSRARATLARASCHVFSRSIYTRVTSCIWSIVLWLCAEPMLDPKCQEFTTMCTVDTCTDFCLSIGLGAYQGFCSFHDLTMYCCCPIPAGTPPRRTWLWSIPYLSWAEIIFVTIDLCERPLAGNFSC
jgi:hypothetical protein